MTISDFYENSTKIFDVTIYYDGVVADISGDDVYLYLKRTKNESDDDAVLVSEANVATAGASGIATFTFTDTDTLIPVQRYYLEIVWETAEGNRFVVHQQAIDCLNKLQDNV